MKQKVLTANLHFTMALRTEKIFVLCLLVSCCQCSSFTFKEGLNNVLTFLDIKPDEISKSCYNQLSELRENLENPGSELWGLEMIDASSKVQSGMMSFNTGELGNFEQCINTKGTLSSGKEVRGKYCLGRLSIHPLKVHERFKDLNKRLQQQVLVQLKSLDINNVVVPENATTVLGPTWAGCFPDGCSTADVNQIANQFVRIFVDTTAIIIFDDEYCQTEEDVNSGFTPGATSAMTMLSLYFAFVIGCTGCDILCQKQNIGTSPPLEAFSLYSNTKNLFRITDDPHYMPCLDGLKVLSMMWVVLGHQYSITFSGPVTNTSQIIEWADSIRSMFIVNSTLSADTFLVISAFLLTTRFLKAKSENISTPFYRLWFRRYIRLAPALVFTVLVSGTFLTHLGSGPRWPSVRLYFQENCANHWWSTLLFIQNYLNRQNMCIAQSWYLSIDMQLFIFSPFILNSLHKRNKETGSIIAFCGFLCIALSFYTAWMNDLSAILSNPYGDVERYNKDYYLLTHTRASPWFMGVLCGNWVYLYDKKRFPERLVKIVKAWSPLIWVFCWAVLLACVFIHHDLRYSTYDMWKNVFHIALVRTYWAFAICWIIIACVTNTGKISRIINKILSYPLFQILRRFVYSMYLVHVTTMYLISLSRRTAVYFSDFDMIHLFWGNLVFSWFVAFFWVVVFESPFICFEKIFRKIRVQEDPSADEPSTPGSRGRSHQEEFGMMPIVIFNREETSSEESAETEEEIVALDL